MSGLNLQASILKQIVGEIIVDYNECYLWSLDVGAISTNALLVYPEYIVRGVAMNKGLITLFIRDDYLTIHVHCKEWLKQREDSIDFDLKEHNSIKRIKDYAIEIIEYKKALNQKYKSHRRNN